MSTLVKTTTFVDGPGHFILSAEVNQNFDEIITFLNNLVVHTDGSKVFTGIPTGPATDPTSDNQFTRKAYVDAATAGSGSAVAVETAARVAADNAIVAQANTDRADAIVQDNVIFGALYGHFAGGRLSVTTNGSGDFTISFGRTLSSVAPGVTVTDGSGASLTYAAYSVTGTGATVRCFNPATGIAEASRAITVNWTAVAS